MDDQSRRRLMDASKGILTAEALLRFYAYVPEATSEHVSRARGEWNAALDTLWPVLQDRELVQRNAEEIRIAAEAMVILLDRLAGDSMPPEDVRGDTPGPMP